MSGTSLRCEPGMSVLRDHALVYVPGLTVRSTCPECGRVHVRNPGREPLTPVDKNPDLLMVKFSCTCGTPARIVDWIVTVRLTVTAVLEQDHG